MHGLIWGPVGNRDRADGSLSERSPTHVTVVAENKLGARVQYAAPCKKCAGKGRISEDAN
jgi:hypothetical protein